MRARPLPVGIAAVLLALLSLATLLVGSLGRGTRRHNLPQLCVERTRPHRRGGAVNPATPVRPASRPRRAALRRRRAPRPYFPFSFLPLPLRGFPTARRSFSMSFAKAFHALPLTNTRYSSSAIEEALSPAASAM